MFMLFRVYIDTYMCILIRYTLSTSISVVGSQELKLVSYIP